MSQLKQDLGLNAIAEGNQDGREAERDAGQNDQGERDHPLFHQPPALGQFVAAAKALHPRDHDAGPGPQRDQRSRDQHAHRTLGCASQIRQRRGAARGKNLAQRVGNLAQVGFSMARSGQHRPDQQQRGEKREDGRIRRRFSGGERVMLKRAPKGEAKQAQETQHEWPKSIVPGHRMQLRSAACVPDSAIALG